MSFNSGFFIEQASTDPTQYSMQFDGVNEYALIPNHAGINFDYTDNFSMTSWVNFADYSTPSFRWIFSKRDVNYRGYLMAFNGGNLYVFLAASIGSLMLIRTNGVTFTNNNWYNVGFTYNGSGLPSGVTIYVNGVSVSTVLVSGGGINASLSHAFPLYLSYDMLEPAFSNFKLGIIRFWKTLLSPSEMLQDYNGGTMLNNPIALSDMTFEFGAGRSALFGTQWVFPIASENPTAYSVNMEFVDRVNDIP